MVKLSDYRGGNLLKCADLGRKEHLVQIESIAEEDVGEGRKLVARFEGKTKGLVLNDTNLEALEAAFGPDSDDAIGGQVILLRRSGCPLRRAEGRRHQDQAAEEGQCKRKGRAQRREHGRISERRSARLVGPIRPGRAHNAPRSFS